MGSHCSVTIFTLPATLLSTQPEAPCLSRNTGITSGHAWKDTTMKRLCCALALSSLIFFCSPRIASHRGGTPVVSEPFDMESFGRRLALASELAADDRFAWESSDSIIFAKPFVLDSTDKTWFIDKRAEGRLAFYGRYDTQSDAYIVKSAFSCDSPGVVRRIPPDADERTHTIARIVAMGTRRFEEINDSLGLGVEFNHYIRRNDTGFWTMWFFPAGYDNYCAHGLDIIITIDPQGNHITECIIEGSYLRYFELERKAQKVELDNGFDSMPSLGNLFFTCINRHNFDTIAIINRGSVSRLVYRQDSDGWAWDHLRTD